MRTALLPLSALSLLVLSACGNVVSLGGGSTGSGGSGGQGGSDPATTSVGPTTSAATGTSAASTGAGAPCVFGGPNDDFDGDGFTTATGDCNDCDRAMNPGAIELATAPGESPRDEDCDGIDDNLPQPCDASFAVDDADPLDAARAVELCKMSAGPGDWGVVSASWVLPDGSAPPAVPAFDVGHGLVAGFGPNVAPRKGQRMVALSSGTARQPTDVGYQSPAGYVKFYTGNPPAGFPKESPACPGVTTGQPNDGAGLEVVVRAPTNAIGFSFEFNYYTHEWPSYICSMFNDVFVAIISPIPMGQTDGNISFDSMGNTVSVNSVFLDVCGCTGASPCMAGGKAFPCALGNATLVGNGFGADLSSGIDHGSTEWLTTTAPVQPGSTITLRWGVYDSGDGTLDTTTLVDNWRWLTAGTPVVQTFRP